MFCVTSRAYTQFALHFRFKVFSGDCISAFQEIFGPEGVVLENEYATLKSRGSVCIFTFLGCEDGSRLIVMNDVCSM
jgi:hypothetical protein